MKIVIILETCYTIVVDCGKDLICTITNRLEINLEKIEILFFGYRPKNHGGLMTTLMDNEETEVNDFYKAVLFESLIYHKFLLLNGYDIDPIKIRELELEVYPELNEPSYNSNNSLGLRELDDLRLLLYLVDPHPEDIDRSTKALVIRLENVLVRIRCEHNHQRPHFHIEYKQQFNASYAIDTFEKLAGNMPDKYEKKILEWAVDKKTQLISIWNNLQAGLDITEYLLQVR